MKRRCSIWALVAAVLLTAAVTYNICYVVIWNNVSARVAALEEKENRYAKLSEIQACLDDLDARTSGLEEAAKPLCLTAAATFRGGHGITGVYSDSAILSAINARDAATGLADRPKGVEVDKEQILAWDPAVIILDAGNLALVKDEYVLPAAERRPKRTALSVAERHRQLHKRRDPARQRLLRGHAALSGSFCRRRF